MWWFMMARGCPSYFHLLKIQLSIHKNEVHFREPAVEETFCRFMGLWNGELYNFLYKDEHLLCGNSFGHE